MARSTGAAPRQRGSSEKCRFTIGICFEEPGRDDAAVGHHDRELDAGARQVVHVVGDGEPELGGGHLDGAGRLRLAAAAAAVGARHAECDVVTRGDQRAQRRHRHVRGAEVRQAGHPFTVGQTALPG